MTDHPDYLDYKIKTKVKRRAEYYDVKYLLKKLCDVRLDKMYVKRVVDGHWDGWLVDFSVDVDLPELKRSIYACLIVGERSIFIGVYHG